MKLPRNARDVPPHQFLPQSAYPDYRRHRLFARQIGPLQIPALDGRSPEITLARGTALLEAMKESMDLTWWIGVGTALGFAREQGFIVGDTDLDVRIGLDFRDEAAAVAMAAEVVRRFQADGFRIVREMYWDRRPMQTAFYDTRNHDVVFDIFYFYTSYTSGCYVNFNEVGSREKPAHLIEHLERSHWPGHPDITVYLPSPLDEYNRWRWGPEWHVPKKNSELDRALDLACIKDLPDQHVVLTYGTFDLFHDGHVKLLERAAALGGRLVVGVVSDELLYLKGKRNAYTQEQRLDIVGALRCVDEVFLQRELDQKESDIERFDASYLVFGDDWTGHPRVEQVRGYRGVEVVYLPRTRGVSSTALRQRVRDATLVEAYESIHTYLGALAPEPDYQVRELGDDGAGLDVDAGLDDGAGLDADAALDVEAALALDVEAALSDPDADKVVLFQDRASQKRYAVLFELVCQATIVVDLNRLEVHKKVTQFRELGVVERESSWLKRFHGCSFVPQLISVSGDVIVTRYVGEPVRRYNLPADWREQAEDILHHLERKGCRHNDIKCDNLMVFNGQLYLVDFSFATSTDEAVPQSWPPGLGRQHRIDVHQFDDRKAIYEALESAERDEIDHSVRLAPA